MKQEINRNKKLSAILVSISLGILLCLITCKPKDNTPTPALTLVAKEINAVAVTQTITRDVALKPTITITFSTAIDEQSIADAVTFKNTATLSTVAYTSSLSTDKKTLTITPVQSLQYYNAYSVAVSSDLKSSGNKFLDSNVEIKFNTLFDSSDKFSRISDEALIDTVQHRTFNYFWKYGHPTSGLARDATERNDLDDCTIGGTGFGIMTLPGAVKRNYITRSEALQRMQRLVNFLKNTAKNKNLHGAFPHRINGVTGDIILWQGAKDDGADIVETSFLMMGLLTARQFFDGADTNETALRNDITALYNAVEWTWFERTTSVGGADKKSLWWLWSSTIGFGNSFMCRGWNETLIVYVLAASSSTHGIEKATYDYGYAGEGSIKNGTTVLGYVMPFGSNYGGFAGYTQYSFLGINPFGLTDAYGDYELHQKNFHLINQAYCIFNPKKFFNYSESCWGFNGDAQTDDGTIQPYVAMAAFPYTPEPSLKALRYFYYTLGNKIFLNYGFASSFNLANAPISVKTQQFAYDELNVCIALENYRSQLIWNLFTSCPEVKAGMKKLGFRAPYLN